MPCSAATCLVYRQATYTSALDSFQRGGQPIFGRQGRVSGDERVSDYLQCDRPLSPGFLNQQRRLDVMFPHECVAFS